MNTLNICMFVSPLILVQFSTHCYTYWILKDLGNFISKEKLVSHFVSSSRSNFCQICMTFCTQLTFRLAQMTSKPKQYRKQIVTIYGCSTEKFFFFKVIVNKKSSLVSLEYYLHVLDEKQRKVKHVHNHFFPNKTFFGNINTNGYVLYSSNLQFCTNLRFNWFVAYIFSNNNSKSTYPKQHCRQKIHSFCRQCPNS